MMQAELRDSLENLFPDSPIRRNLCRKMTLDVARGGTVAVHLLIHDAPVGQPVKLSAQSASGRPVHAEWFRLIDVPVEQNTGLVGFTMGAPELNVPPYKRVRNNQNPYVVRKAPFRAYDAMEPVGTRTGPSKPTMAFRLHIPIPRDARPGPAAWSLSVTVGDTTCDFKLAARIHKVVLPLPGRDTHPVTNWFSYDNIASRHGLKMWSEAHFAMLRRYAKLMYHGRQNSFWFPLQIVFKKTPKGMVLLRDRMERIISIFLKEGFYFIEGGHMAGRAQWGGATFQAVFGKQEATKPEGHAEIASVCSQLMAVIRRNHWEDRWIQHVADEPIAASAADYRILVGMVHKYMPGICLMDATQHTSLVGSVDAWCPQVQEYQRDRKEYEAQRALGDKVWYYTCCFPGGPWMNRLLDQELLRPALIGWGGALFQLDGFLHWGLNHYRADQDPFKMSVLPNHAGGKNSLPPGDTHIVYPGKGAPWSSLRLESHREGFEDHDLIRRLQARNPRKAAAILKPVVRGFDRYTKDVRVFRAGRRALLEALHA